MTEKPAEASRSSQRMRQRPADEKAENGEAA